MYDRFGAPKRSRKNPDGGIDLRFRTRPKPNTQRLLLTSNDSINAQIYLYRWVRSLDYVNNASISDIHSFISSQTERPLSKKSMGMSVHQAVGYDPTVLVGATKVNPSPVRTWRFQHRLDLQYGLEWQMCVWLRHLTVKGSTIEIDLEDISTMEERELEEFFFNALNEKKAEGRIIEPAWNQMAEDYGWRTSEFVGLGTKEKPVSAPFTKDMIRTFGKK